MSTSLLLTLIAASLPSDPVVRADLLFTTALTTLLLLQGGMALALLPWREADLRGLELGARAVARRVAGLRSVSEVARRPVGVGRRLAA